MSNTFIMTKNLALNLCSIVLKKAGITDICPLPLMSFQATKNNIFNLDYGINNTGGINDVYWINSDSLFSCGVLD